MFRFLQKQPVNIDDFRGTTFNCSGCRGLIKFGLIDSDSEENLWGARFQTEGERPYANILDSPFLQALPAGKVDETLSNFQEINIPEGEVLIRKGELNHNLYLVCAGELSLDEGGQRTIVMPGELCGEMSYLGPDIAVATIRASRATKLLAISGDAFGRLFSNNPAVQSFMAQLLADRLRRTSAARARDLDSCMVGRIEEIVPAELFQIFHLQQKTGVLTLELSGGTGKVSFREGCLINARYGEWQNEEAVFKILAEKEGRYRFTSGLQPQDMRAAEIGDFMSLLMEGVKRVDEEGDPFSQP